MIYRKILLYLTVFTLCLLISIAWGQDWLGGGYVGPYGGDIAQYFIIPPSTQILHGEHTNKAGSLINLDPAFILDRMGCFLMTQSLIIQTLD
jgi:hypothetical protein